jgi:hypothetical protein
MSNALSDDARIRRRLWFTVHVLVYCAVALLQVLIWPAQPLLLAAQSALLVTIIVHLYGLYASGFDTLIPQPIPMNGNPGESQRVTVKNDDLADSFWYRWHDV